MDMITELSLFLTTIMFYKQWREQMRVFIYESFLFDTIVENDDLSGDSTRPN
jgi:hypothetical protein